LVSLWPNLSFAQQQQLTPALIEYIDIQNFNNDRGFSFTNRANVDSYQGKFDQAISQYQKSIFIEPIFVPAYIHLADLYRQLQQTDHAINTLHDGLKVVPDSADIAFSLGLAYIRDKQINNAVDFLEKATLFNDSNAYYFYVYAYAYVYGLSLEDINRLKAYKALNKALNKAYELSRDPQHLFVLCEMQIRQNFAQAHHCVDQLSIINYQLSLVAHENLVAPLKLKLKSMSVN
jgi:tetratricopeptide (TPR) repeat protein